MALVPLYIKRVNREIQNENFNKKINDDLSCYLCNNNVNSMIFQMFIGEKYVANIELNFGPQYPFRNPKVKINNMLYHSVLKSNLPNILYKATRRRCLCCSSLTCSYNWKPINNTYDLLNEIKNNLEIKIKCIELLHVYKIKNKYLIDDIPIEKFL